MAKAPAKADTKADQTDAQREQASAQNVAETKATAAPRPADPKTNVDPVTGADVVPQKVTLTGHETHRATQTGYDSKGGQLVAEGEIVPAGLPVSKVWMEKTKGDGKAERAAAEAADDRKGDPSLDALDLGALQALATLAGVQDVTGLSKKDLVTAINATAEQRRFVSGA